MSKAQFVAQLLVTSFPNFLNSYLNCKKLRSIYNTVYCKMPGVGVSTRRLLHFDTFDMSMDQAIVFDFGGHFEH